MKQAQKKKVVIIGAGLAGMSAGYYLQVNGFETQIFEMHSSPGGLCASWERNGYMIDGCIHFMAGTAPTEPSYQFWNDLLDMDSIRFIYSPTHAVVENHKQERIHFYSDVDLLEMELKSKAPQDAKQIEKLTRIIRKFIKVRMPFDKPYETMSLVEKIRVAKNIFPYLGSIYRHMRITNSDFAEGFSDPDMRRAFTIAFVGNAPFFYSIMPLVWRHKKEMGYPEGGAVRVAEAIEEKFIRSGGRIIYNSPVTRILVRNDNVYGIELQNGDRHEADIVISAADGRSTVYELLNGKFKDKKVTDRYEDNVFENIDKTLYVALGINKDFSDQPRKLYFPLKTPIRIDPMTTLDYLEISHYCEDASAAPKGKSLLTLMPDAKDWQYWERLRKEDHPAYKSEKERIATEIIDALDQRFSGVKKNIEMVDVVTPATYIRYTNNWTGGQISWKGTKKTFGKTTAWQIKGLKNFYMTGQWAGVSGGLNNVVMMGNHLTQIICKKEGLKFKR